MKEKEKIFKNEYLGNSPRDAVNPIKVTGSKPWPPTEE
jgi:hypothetical protein